ncbi:MAG: hypothetical protein WBM90_09130, partial [Acidimicrobiia bacterium]
VLKRLHESNNAEDGLSLLGGIWRFYQSQGQLLELELWLDRFFALADPSVPSIGLTRGLMARGALRYWQRDLGLAGNDYRLAVETARQFDDELLLAEALYGLSSSLVVSGDDQEAKPLMEEARAIYERRGDKGGVADIIAGEAFATLAVGGLIGLGPALTEARDLYAAAGRSINAVQTRYAIAGVAIAEGRLGDARNSAREGVEAATSLNDPFLTVWGLEYLALIDIETGLRDRGAKIVGACQTARVSIGGGWGPDILGLKDGKETLEDMIGVDQAEAMISPGRTLSIFDAVRLALGTDPSEP